MRFIHTLIIPEELIEREKSILSLRQRIAKAEASGSIFAKLFLSWKSNTLKRRERLQNYEIDFLLLKTDVAYAEKARQSIALFETPEINFTVYTREFAGKGTYTTAIDGIMDPNGYSYLYTSDTNTESIFDRYRFPNLLEGRINHWGEIQLDLADSDSSIRKLPKRFLGTIDKDGKMVLKTTDRKEDFFNPDYLIIWKLIANHFGNDSEKLIAFYENKKWLNEKRSAYRASLLNGK